jgi:hypothetical protein
MNTSQVWKRMRVNVARYEPDVVILWCGINDAWNMADVEHSSPAWSSWLDGVVWRSRLWRFLRVFQHNRSLERAMQVGITGGLPQQGAERGSNDETRRLAHGGHIDEIRHVPSDDRDVDEIDARRYANYQRMAHWLGANGIELVLVSYPLEFRAFAKSNDAMRRVAEETEIALVDSRASLARIPQDKRKWLPGAHPNALLYHEIARDIVARLLDRDGPGR